MPDQEEILVKAAFGEANRNYLIDKYFSGHGVDDILPGRAWEHVYRLLLWVDRTTGLGHCYESDKSQPGKRWYSRSLAFHGWVSRELGFAPGELASKIDWLFVNAAKDLAASVQREAQQIALKAVDQRVPYEGRGFPKPGEDPELVAIISEELGGYLAKKPATDDWNRLVQRVRQYLAVENKRKNIVGEGFEDVVSQVLRRSCRDTDIQVHTRRSLHELPGFGNRRANEKPNKVDLAITRPAMRTIVTAKWSVRADRERQFVADFADYTKAESDNKPFQYSFITNEFDPARLTRACELLYGHTTLFKHVIHINTDAIRATYLEAGGNSTESASMNRVLQLVEEGRIISLDNWIGLLQLT